MNFDFSDDQKLLADQVQRFLDEQCGTAVVRGVLENPPRFVPEVWQGLTDMGLIGTAVVFFLWTRKDRKLRYPTPHNTTNRQ